MAAHRSESVGADRGLWMDTITRNSQVPPLAVHSPSPVGCRECTVPRRGRAEWWLSLPCLWWAERLLERRDLRRSAATVLHSRPASPRRAGRTRAGSGHRGALLQRSRRGCDRRVPCDHAVAPGAPRLADGSIRGACGVEPVMVRSGSGHRVREGLDRCSYTAVIPTHILGLDHGGSATTRHWWLGSWSPLPTGYVHRPGGTHGSRSRAGGHRHPSPLHDRGRAPLRRGRVGAARRPHHQLPRRLRRLRAARASSSPSPGR